MRTWTKKPPSAEGWYWVKYHGKHGLTRSPALVLNVKTIGFSMPLRGSKHIAMVEVARGGMFVFGRSKEEERRQGVLWFGPCIPVPK